MASEFEQMMAELLGIQETDKAQHMPLEPNKIDVGDLVLDDFRVPPQPVAQETPLDTAKRLLADKGYGPAAIAGILGNVDVETGGSFDPSQKQYGGGPGHGLFQFDFMKPYYFKWLGDREDSIESQIDFMHDMIYGDQQDILGRGNAKKLQDILAGEDVEAAAKGFMDIFEKPSKPHLDRRLQSAKNLYEKFFS